MLSLLSQPPNAVKFPAGLRPHPVVTKTLRLFCGKTAMGLTVALSRPLLRGERAVVHATELNELAALQCERIRPVRTVLRTGNIQRVPFGNRPKTYSAPMMAAAQPWLPAKWWLKTTGAPGFREFGAGLMTDAGSGTCSSISRQSLRQNCSRHLGKGRLCSASPVVNADSFVQSHAIWRRQGLGREGQSL